MPTCPIFARPVTYMLLTEIVDAENYMKKTTSLTKNKRNDKTQRAHTHRYPKRHISLVYCGIKW